MVKCMPSGAHVVPVLGRGHVRPGRRSESCRTILGLPEVPLEKYMSMGSCTSVSTRSKSCGALRTPVLKSIHPSRSTGAAQMPSGPLRASPTSTPSPTSGQPSSSRGVRPPPAPFTRMNDSTLGQLSRTLSMMSAMSPTDVAMMAFAWELLRRYSRSCSLSMKVAGTMTAPILASAVAMNQNW